MTSYRDIFAQYGVTPDQSDQSDQPSQSKTMTSYRDIFAQYGVTPKQSKQSKQSNQSKSINYIDVFSKYGIDIPSQDDFVPMPPNCGPNKCGVSARIWLQKVTGIKLNSVYDLIDVSTLKTKYPTSKSVTKFGIVYLPPANGLGQHWAGVYRGKDGQLYVAQQQTTNNGVIVSTHIKFDELTKNRPYFLWDFSSTPTNTNIATKIADDKYIIRYVQKTHKEPELVIKDVRQALRKRGLKDEKLINEQAMYYVYTYHPLYQSDNNKIEWAKKNMQANWSSDESSVMQATISELRNYRNQRSLPYKLAVKSSDWLSTPSQSLAVNIGKGLAQLATLGLPALISTADKSVELYAGIKSGDINLQSFLNQIKTQLTTKQGWHDYPIDNALFVYAAAKTGIGGAAKLANNSAIKTAINDFELLNKISAKNFDKSKLTTNETKFLKNLLKDDYDNIINDVNMNEIRKYFIVYDKIWRKTRNNPLWKVNDFAKFVDENINFEKINKLLASTKIVKKIKSNPKVDKFAQKMSDIGIRLSARDRDALNNIEQIATNTASIQHETIKSYNDIVDVVKSYEEKIPDFRKLALQYIIGELDTTQLPDDVLTALREFREKLNDAQNKTLNFELPKSRRRFIIFPIATDEIVDKNYAYIYNKFVARYDEIDKKIINKLLKELSQEDLDDLRAHHILDDDYKFDPKFVDIYRETQDFDFFNGFVKWADTNKSFKNFLDLIEKHNLLPNDLPSRNIAFVSKLPAKKIHNILKQYSFENPRIAKLLKDENIWNDQSGVGVITWDKLIRVKNKLESDADKAVVDKMIQELQPNYDIAVSLQHSGYNQLWRVRKQAIIDEVVNKKLISDTPTEHHTVRLDSAPEYGIIYPPELEGKYTAPYTRTWLNNNIIGIDQQYSMLTNIGNIWKAYKMTSLPFHLRNIISNIGQIYATTGDMMTLLSDIKEVIKAYRNIKKGVTDNNRLSATNILAELNIHTPPWRLSRPTTGDLLTKKGVYNIADVFNINNVHELLQQLQGQIFQSIEGFFKDLAYYRIRRKQFIDDIRRGEIVIIPLSSESYEILREHSISDFSKIPFITKAIKEADTALYNYEIVPNWINALRKSGYNLIVPFPTWSYKTAGLLAKTYMQHPERILGLRIMLDTMELLGLQSTGYIPLEAEQTYLWSVLPESTLKKLLEDTPINLAQSGEYNKLKYQQVDKFVNAVQLMSIYSPVVQAIGGMLGWDTRSGIRREGTIEDQLQTKMSDIVRTLSPSLVNNAIDVYRYWQPNMYDKSGLDVLWGKNSKTQQPNDINKIVGLLSTLRLRDLQAEYEHMRKLELKLMAQQTSSGDTAQFETDLKRKQLRQIAYKKNLLKIMIDIRSGKYTEDELKDAYRNLNSVRYRESLKRLINQWQSTIKNNPVR